ncbi:MAG: transcription elongation factor GreA, partial [Treponemataceae bacterium]|nr:transcription elongation factor GreA [Treponemataceae bacterium]
MSELVTKVQEMLKEETWTRATISNYTKNNLIELANILEQAKKEDVADEVKAICDEQLASNRDSIIALYISGMLALKKGTLDTSALETLVDIFRKNHKENVVVYLCESILEDDASNKFALRTLASCYREDKNEKIWDIYERLVKIDFEEADAAKLLGDHYEPGDKELAIDYYKKALLRYVNAKNYTAVSEVWKKLVQLVPEEIDFFMLVQRKIAKTISADKSALLMQDLYGWYKDTKKWDTAIDILKLILSIDPKDNWARRELVECYTGKYAGHSNVADYIRSSNLGQSFRNVFEAINDFEKHIAFDVKHFVFHRTWHVGIIRKVENDTLTINFGKKNGVREMSLKMAVDALQPLADDHIWVLKATKAKDELAKQVKADKAWALKTIIKSFNGSCDFKRIKAELVPAILTPGEWTGWNSAAKKILENDATFGVNPNDINEYIVRDREITTEEKLNSEFKAQKKFFERIDILMRYLNDEATEKESDLFADMFSYFTGYVKSFATTNDANEQVVASYLVVQKVTARCPNLSVPAKYSFEKLYRRIKNPRAMYDELKDTKNTTLREDYLNDIKMLPDWVD